MSETTFENLRDIMPPGFMDYHEYQRYYDNSLFEHLTKPYELDFEERAGKMEYIPEKDRKPSFVASIGKQVVETVVSHTFGQDNFPQILAKTKNDVFSGISDEDETNLALQKFIDGVVQETHLNAAMLKSARNAVSQSESVVLTKLVKGVPEFEVLNRKWITKLELDPEDGRTIDFVEETKLLQDPDDGEWYWHRRTVDKFSEIIFHPELFEDSDDEFPEFRKSTEYIYNLETCPAYLLQNVDGKSIFEGQMGNIIEYSYLVTAILVGTKKNMNPQRIFMGDEPPDGEFTRSSDSFWAMPQGKFISDAPNPQSYLYAQQEEERIRELILRGCRVIEIPDGNYQSAEALKLKLAPETNLVQESRIEMGNKGMTRLLMGMCNFIIELNSPGKTVTKIVDGTEESFSPEIDLGYDVEIPMVPDFRITLGWGEIFSSTSQTKNIDVQTAALATNAELTEDPLFSKSALRKHNGRNFGISDLNAENAQLEQERIRRHVNACFAAAIKAAGDNNDIKFLGLLAEKMSEGTDDDNLITFLHEYGEQMKKDDLTALKEAASEREYTDPQNDGDDQTERMAGRDSGSEKLGV